jgi:hypothetical protein
MMCDEIEQMISMIDMKNAHVLTTVLYDRVYQQ